MRIASDPRRLIWSASDLTAASECEFGWLRQIDARLGRCAPVDDPEDAMLRRAAQLGDAHELRTLERYRERFGDAVIDIARVSASDDDAMGVAVADTNEALADPTVQVLFQAAFRANDFVGFADFLVRDEDGRWRVQDTKLARTARVTALMQLSAYVDRLDQQGIPRADNVDLLLGDGTTSVHRTADLMPLFHLRRERLQALIADRRIDADTSHPAIAWGDARGKLRILACGACAACRAEIEQQRDILLVAGLRPAIAERLRAASIHTIDQLAQTDAAPPRIANDTFDSLRTQARLQLATEQRPDDEPLYEVVNEAALGAMPRPDLGDIFLHLDRDPFFADRADDGRTEWGLSYLLGWGDMRQQHSTLWAHDLPGERRALERFCDFLQQHRRAHPQAHIFHFRPDAPAILAQMAARHGSRETDIDRLLGDETFVDLFPIVKNALRIGTRSYDITALEPLIMGPERRERQGEPTHSALRYVEARALREAGHDDDARDIMMSIAADNGYACLTTRRLRDWLVERAKEARVTPAREDGRISDSYEPSPRALALTARADELRDVRLAQDPASSASNDENALRLAAAAIDYYPREARSFWQAHYERLREPISLWGETKDVIVVDIRRSDVLDDWHIPEGSRAERRVLELRGALAPGTRLSVGSTPSLLYTSPAPFPTEGSQRWLHVPHEARVVDVLDDGVIVEEYAIGGRTWRELPVALTPPSPPKAGAQQGAIEAWADGILTRGTHIGASDGAFPIDPATDLLRSLRADHHSGRVVSSSIGSDIDAIVFSLLSVPTYLAVQGPPGTGKTYVGSHVIARLVNEHGWKVGVVAQSHAVVENMLDRVVAAGVPQGHVGKVLKGAARADGQSFTVLPRNGLSAFQQQRTKGYVIGGTAWDFANVTRVGRRELDLLVVDEAGQFSLASTIAVSMSARRLLLLGDPQQLPQVSQGTHPAPIDQSALGWVMRDQQVLPEGHGYFLARTWRMHPDVATPVSHLSYGGQLRSRPGADLRHAEGIEPGVHPIPVLHTGNATDSPEEAEQVVRIVRDVIGRPYVDIDIDDEQEATPCEPRPLDQADVIVVAPYNAQQQTVERALAAAGFRDVRVGTVDKFQGQEAAIAIMTLAASSGRDAPRGIDFLLLQNRLNVGISRAKVAAYLVHSPLLLDDLPFRAESVARLSAFARLVGRG
ncbi:AAA domain-containing protein [Microbacterium amylolyticum]|uniref:DNA2/NAM7 helicase-like C-terminal domain-containing protein n=1 Tax=Microbacterium amylolyticum TaxID=936337 RepID=A0ABS4ZJ39_9MICO|nr:bifunctional RecB family nuclease/DEAD/DEAH box helicase [Microbacterium amylolyticum]MBP2437309.1 uncharacterized protein [Microbacterium amylolyticum]